MQNVPTMVYLYQHVCDRALNTHHTCAKTCMDTKLGHANAIDWSFGLGQ